MSFQTKLFLVFVGFSIAVSLLMLYFTLQSKELLTKEADENRRNFARVIHVSAQRLSAIPENKPEVINQLIKELQTNESVNEVTIIDKNQQVVASTNPKLIGQFHPLSSMDAVVDEKDETVEAFSRQSLFEVSVPLIRDKRISGLIRSTVVMKDLRYPLEMLYYKNLLITIAVLLVGLGFSFAMLRNLNRPLRQLIRAAEKVASGDLSVNIEATLSDEIGRLNATFNMMTAKLAEQKILEKRVNQLERHAIVAEMSAHMAHEIRNPLNMIALTAHHLGNHFSPKEEALREKHQDLIRSLKSEVEHLNKMVTNFISLGKQSNIMRASFKLLDIISQIESLIKQQIVAKNIIYEVTCPPDFTVFADKEQLRLVLLNLIINAIEAVPQGGHISLSAEKKAIKDSPSIGIVVSDNGLGIPPENIALMFEPYFTKKPDGVGLGLSLVKRVVEAHGGEVRAENIITGGARFEIVLPMEA